MYIEDYERYCTFKSKWLGASWDLISVTLSDYEDGDLFLEEGEYNFLIKLLEQTKG